MQFDGKQTYYKTSDNIPLKEKILHKLVHIYLSKFYSEEYISYLKEKTVMNFKTALDIGARYGIFVERLNKMGINAYGIESDQKTVKLAVTDKIRWEYFDNNYKTDKKYDLIALSQVLYYIPDNKTTLGLVSEMLERNGILFIATYVPGVCNISSGTVYEILSKNELEYICKELGLELIDYTRYTSNISADFTDNKDKKIAYLKYRLGLRKGLVRDDNGGVAFLLFRKSIP